MSNFLTAMLAVFTSIGAWFTETLPTFTGLFYSTVTGEEGFTMLGYLAIAGLGISIVFLLVNVISRFLKFRG